MFTFTKIKKAIINSERLLFGLLLLFVTLPICWCIDYDKLVKFVREAGSIICFTIAFILIFTPVMNVHPIRCFVFFIYTSLVLTLDHHDILENETF